MPFEDSLVLKLHYAKHKNEFSFASEIDYQAAADSFMTGPPAAPTRECVRPDGDRIRFNRRNGFLAVQAPSGLLKTFHKVSDKYVQLGYFRWECGRTDVS